MRHVSWNVPHDPLHPTDTECMEICDDHEWKCPYGKVCERHEDTLEGFSLMGWLCVPKWHHGTTHTDAVTADEPEEEQS